MDRWQVVDESAVTPHFKDLSKYISAMERAGWVLRHVDSGKLYFEKGDTDGTSNGG